MSKSKLLVPVVLYAVLASAVASGPQDESNSKTALAKTGVAQKSVTADNSVVVLENGKEQGPRFENIAINATPENRWLHEMLSKPVPRLDFPGETPVSEILDAISSFYTTKFGTGAGHDGGNFRMTFYPDVAELDLEGIASLEDVFVSRVDFEGIKLRHALKLIFDQTTQPELTCVIQNQVMLVTTLAKAQSDDNLHLRVYNVGELADLRFRTDRLPRSRISQINQDRANAAPKRAGTGFFSVPPQRTSGITAPLADNDHKSPKETSDLESLLTEMTSPPARWLSVDGEGGAIRLIGQTLFVRQTPAVQEQIVSILNILDAESTYHTRIYRVGELASLRFSSDQPPDPKNSDTPQSGAARVSANESQQPPVAKSTLESLIIEMAGGDWSDIDGKGPAIRLISHDLVIRQTAAIHRKIVELLDLLSRMQVSEPTNP